MKSKILILSAPPHSFIFLLAAPVHLIYLATPPNTSPFLKTGYNTSTPFLLANFLRPWRRRCRQRRQLHCLRRLVLRRGLCSFYDRRGTTGLRL